MKRKYFLGLSVLVIFSLAVPVLAAQSLQVPLAPNPAAWQFIQPLPLLDLAGGPIKTVFGNQPLTIRMCEFQANVLPPGAVAGYAGTWVWGYLLDPDPTAANTCARLVDLYDDGTVNGTSGPLGTYTGPVILNTRGTPTEITWVNDLGTTATTNVQAYKYSTDQTLHWADPLNAGKNMCNHMAMIPGFNTLCAQNYDGPIPAVVHLHGGEVPPELDGGPDAWFTSDGTYHGNGYYTKSALDAANTSVYAYPNTQEASPIWFHDHTLGATRLNVYAGLAGGYLISDPNQALPAGLWAYGLSRQGNVGGDELTIPLVIQDRMFDNQGQLFFTADSAGGLLWALNPEHPYWNPEFIGDTILVNGKAWPFLNVEAKRYRFLFLNGSNARTYEMSLLNQAAGTVGPPMWVIGTDGGYLDAPVKLDPALGQTLLMQPGERYEVIIDFAGFANTNLIIRNTGRTPFPKGAPPQGSTLGRILQFRVGAAPAVDPGYDPASGVPLRSGTNAIARLTTAGAPPAVVAKTRELTLNEIALLAQTVIDPVTGLLTAFPGGPVEILVNNTLWSGKRINGVDAGGHFTFEARADFTAVTVGSNTSFYSELPREGDTEVWEIVNMTADAHPIHLHLVQFQLINRQNYNASNFFKGYSAAFPGGGFDPTTGLSFPPGVFIPGFGPPKDYRAANNALSGGKDGGNPDITPFLQGPVQLPLPQERGWKDTIIAFPGQVTRIAVRWAPTGLPTAALASQLFYPFDPTGGDFPHGYVWHCHIVDHEDNEMMRPDLVQLNAAAPAPAARSLVKGTNY